jgi:NAD(P)-dependent dehydrogenase (short-subunit alcohol dehydrogenase family)
MMDVTDKASIVEARRVIEKKEGKLHILVNKSVLAHHFCSRHKLTPALSAGQVGPVSDTSALDAQTLGDALFQESPDAWAKLHAVNTFSVYYVTTAFLRLLDEGSKDVHGYTSCVINITSISGIVRLAQGHVCVLHSPVLETLVLTEMSSLRTTVRKLLRRI